MSAMGSSVDGPFELYCEGSHPARVSRSHPLDARLSSGGPTGANRCSRSWQRLDLAAGATAVLLVPQSVRPSILLADEPTGNLHSSQGEEIMELFRKLNDEGVTIVQVTHSDKNASYGKRVIQLRDGWIVNN